jgi:hypothetical protein
LWRLRWLTWAAQAVADHSIRRRPLHQGGAAAP